MNLYYPLFGVINRCNVISYNTNGRMSSEKDHRENSTAHTYDIFGRETTVTFTSLRGRR